MKNNKIKKMASLALLIALIVILQLIGGVLPAVGGFSISLVLLPIVIGAALYGPVSGGVLGGAFGAIVYIFCVTGFDPGGAMVFQANPLLCFLVVMGKGILCGVAAGAVYKLLARKNVYVAMLCAAIVCPVVNTGVFLACMLTVFPTVLSAWASGGDVVAYMLSGIVLVNFVPELLINVVFSPVGQRILQTVDKK